MLLLIPSAGAGTVLSATLAWQLWHRLARRRQQPATPVFQPAAGIRILRDVDEILSVTQQAADREYELAARALLRGNHYTQLMKAAADFGDG